MSTSFSKRNDLLTGSHTKFIRPIFNYYYNNVPGKGLCRNNLIYTSLISEDNKVFCQSYENDSIYHKGQNQVVDPSKMEEKWLREIHYLTLMTNNFPDLVPVIKDIDLVQRKLFLEIDGPDFWERAGCDFNNFDRVLPDWQEQMINIIKAHKSLGLYKYSMHPSSYFVVDGKLKSINYFFAYDSTEQSVTISELLSHISSERTTELAKYSEAMGIKWDEPTSLQTAQQLCFSSFSNTFPASFTDAAKLVYV
jgi:hypothetical protein